ncbi:acyl-CoA dehydrogenase [Acidiphilium sp.]|uniref:acyl-CoA dehydrogenase n=1 Tax=Acidiphilium sp. TaxID=527 RepID=UPI00258D8202|nr:acyl-CoA dehydrogenase [Acidiphilium sp.]
MDLITALWWLAGIAGAGALIAARRPARLFLAGLLAWLVIGWLTGAAGWIASIILLVVIGAPAALLSATGTRERLLSRRLLPVFRRIMPKMSETERSAIEAGSVWWDAELFAGRPDWSKLLATPKPVLSPEEQSFLDNETERLCDLANDWDSTQIWQDMPPAAWDYAKEAGFLGMIIPRSYGGKGFSALAHSAVVTKLATRCSAAAVSVMVPNSLGPAELLLHYGTEEQKNHYLPRLARGEDVPCFALTNPYAGSDAASITDTGIVVRRMWEGRETLGFLVSCDKRYITLAPVATVVGLAFRVRDPEGLLGDNPEPGITCALIPRAHPGLEIGRRHWPLNAVFQNGPIRAQDMFVPVDMVIGGQAQVGKGWRMLMECLAAGRAISLPSSATGAAKIATNGTSAYAAIRRQFNMPVGRFEAIEEPMGRMGGHLYAMDATRKLSAVAIDIGEKPSVISAIAKYHMTERGRMVVADAMDIAGGKAICMGPGNFLARAWQQIPIAITVEGANIMTRSLIIFGQGAIRCHPYILRLMHAGAESDGRKALRDFDRAFFGYMGFVASNALRAGLTGLGVRRRAPKGAAPELARYYRAADRLSVVLALSSDIAMATLGGALKRKESVTARLGDVLSQLYILSAVLKRYEDDGRPGADLPLVHWAAQDALHRAHTALRELYANYPIRPVGIALRLLCFPFGVPAAAPSDRLHAEISALLREMGPTRARLFEGAWQPRPDIEPLLGALEPAAIAYPRIEAIERRLKDSIRAGTIGRLPQALPLLVDWAGEARQKGLIDAEEAELIRTFADNAAKVIAVDDFPQDFGMAEALQTRAAYWAERDGGEAPGIARIGRGGAKARSSRAPTAAE